MYQHEVKKLAENITASLDNEQKYKETTDNLINLLIVYNESETPLF